MKKPIRLTKTTRNNALSYGIVIVAFVVLQILRAGGGISSALDDLLVPTCAYIVMAISLNLTVGILGELSLGHAGFMSVGAFSGVVAAISLENVIPFVPVRLAIAMIVGAACAAVAGVIVGVPVLRLRGDYLAIVTLAFGEIIKSIITNLYVGVDGSGLHFSLLTNKMVLEEGGKVIINGPIGISSIPTISSFVAGFVLLLVTLFIVLNLTNSRSGRAIMALRDNRIAAESVGIHITKYKLMAFVTSAALAGAAGTLFAMNYSTISANQFDFNTSILILVYVVLGGLGNIWGSIIATTALYILPETVLRSLGNYRMLAYAVLLILVMLATNNPAIRNFFSRFGQLFRGKKKEVSDHE